MNIKYWKRMRLLSKDQKVWAAAHKDGALWILKNQKVPIRYHPKQTKLYLKSLRDLEPIEEANLFFESIPFPAEWLGILSLPTRVQDRDFSSHRTIRIEIECHGDRGQAVLRAGEREKTLDFRGEHPCIKAIQGGLKAIKTPHWKIDLLIPPGPLWEAYLKGGVQAWKALDLQWIQSFNDLNVHLREKREKISSHSKPRIKIVEVKQIPMTGDSSKYVAFTDGACMGNPGPSGLGVVLLVDQKRFEYFEYLGHGTNNIAELTAILRALEKAPDHVLPMYIYTDSSYAIGVLGKNWKAKANLELIAKIKAEAQKFPQVVLIKVKGHAGHPLNERADALARRALSVRH